VGTIPRQKRSALIAFGAAVVLFFAGYAIFRGFGDPDVPSGDVAIVEDLSSDTGTITRADFDRALEQSAARSGAKQQPKPGSPEYEQLRTQALNDLLDIRWIQGEAAQRGIRVPPDEVSSRRQQLIDQSFRSKKEFEQFREESGFTQKDIRIRVRLQILSGRIQQQVLGGLAPVDDSQVSEYYDASSEQFEQPESRDIRLVLNKSRAKVEQALSELQKDSSDAAWDRVAGRFSTDTSSSNTGGQRPGVTEGLLEQPLDKAVFDAPTGELQGPVKTPLGYYVFEVEKVTPSRLIPLDRSTRAQIRRQLEQQQQQTAFASFVDDFGSEWRARTFCAPDFVIDRCANFVGGGHPASAPPGCYDAGAKGGIPDACPAPVALPAPALPGSISIVAPQGNRLPQRPVPAGLEEVTPGLTGGALPPGGIQTAPTQPAP
jgi:foldase protein PrsA